MDILKIIGAGLGSGLSFFVGIYKFFAAMPMFWRVVTNFGTIKEIWNDSQKLFSNLKEHGHPTDENLSLGVGIMKKALTAKLIDLPNLDEAEVLNLIKTFENNIYAATTTIEDVKNGK